MSPLYLICDHGNWTFTANIFPFTDKSCNLITHAHTKLGKTFITQVPGLRYQCRSQNNDKKLKEDD